MDTSGKEKIDARLAEIEAAMCEPSFWADKNRAQALIKEMQDLKDSRDGGGKYDRGNAILTVFAGAGGDDAEDWARMLFDMYRSFAEKRGWKLDLISSSHTDSGGYRSITVEIIGKGAYGTLKSESGVHRLVRISPFDSQSRRHTSFAGVEVVPVVEQSDHIELDEKEIRVDVYRSSGPGGQGVNTTDSAVRLTHIPTGIVVSCQNERSQIQNKATAMAVLQSKLLERRRQEEQAKINALKGDNLGSWGNQMRSYVLAPYQMVKDLRNNHETGNTSAVLNGEIDDFIEAGIRWRRSSAHA